MSSLWISSPGPFGRIKELSRRTYGDYYFTAWGFCLTLLGTFLASLKTIFTNVLQSSSVKTRTSSQAERRTRTSINIGRLPPVHIIVASIRDVLPPPLELHPLDLLARMSPLAFVQCVLYAQFSGELDRVRQLNAGLNPHALGLHGMGYAKLFALLVNGCIAFGLNVVSFAANGKVGPLSMTVAGASLTCVISLFSLRVNRAR